MLPRRCERLHELVAIATQVALLVSAVSLIVRLAGLAPHVLRIENGTHHAVDLVVKLPSDPDGAQTLTLQSGASSTRWFFKRRDHSEATHVLVTRSQDTEALFDCGYLENGATWYVATLTESDGPMSARCRRIAALP